MAERVTRTDEAAALDTGGLVLGPLLRYVDATSASIWVETAGAATVVVRRAGRSWAARTFTVHGHHYALVELDGLQPGSSAPYTVELDGRTAWPPRDGPPLPPSRLDTLEDDRPVSLAFGSCRTSVPHDARWTASHGVDALRAYGLRLAGDPSLPRPDLLLFLGDQVYADETTGEMRAFIERRRDPGEPPWYELRDYQEYAELYRLAWTDPVNRWLLSTVPSAMVFDDHDVRDDWNTSLAWKRRLRSTSWWHRRIVAGLASYWVYQHLGNLSPEARARDPVWRVVAEHRGDGEADLTAVLDDLADRADDDPACYRWSYHRDLGDSRLVVVDSRAARVLDPAHRSMLHAGELAWLDARMAGGVRHLLVATSLPFLLAPGLHAFEAWNEALVAGAWGPRFTAWGERLRQRVDLEHWAAFQHGFSEVADLALSVARGERGPAPDTVAFLSGDVHHSYLSEVYGGRGPEPRSRIVQAVCSPMRNPLPRVMRYAASVGSYGVASPLGRLLARSARVPEPPMRWRTVGGPWFDNCLATLEETGPGLRLTWQRGVVEAGDHRRPALEQVAEVVLAPPRALTAAPR